MYIMKFTCVFYKIVYNHALCSVSLYKHSYHVHRKLYAVQCTHIYRIYTVHRTAYYVQTLISYIIQYIILNAIYSLPYAPDLCTMNSVQYTLYGIHGAEVWRILYAVQCTVYGVHPPYLYGVQCTPYTLHADLVKAKDNFNLSST